MTSFEDNIKVKEQFEKHLTSLVRVGEDIPCIYIGSSGCLSCLGTLRNHRASCKVFYDGWTQAHSKLVEYK